MEGELTFHIQDERVVLDTGCFIHIPTGVLHSFKNEQPTPARMLDLIAPSGMEHFLKEVGFPATDKTTPPAPPTPEARAKFNDIAAKYGIDIVSGREG